MCPLAASSPRQRQIRALGPSLAVVARQKALGLGVRFAAVSSSSQALKMGKGSAGRCSGRALPGGRREVSDGGRTGMADGKCGRATARRNDSCGRETPTNRVVFGMAAPRERVAATQKSVARRADGDLGLGFGSGGPPVILVTWGKVLDARGLPCAANPLSFWRLW